MIDRVLTTLVFLDIDGGRSSLVTDFKFDKHFPRDTPHMTPLKFSEKRAWPGTHDPLNFWGLNANCSSLITDTDFKFDKHVLWDSPVMTFKNSWHTKGNVPPIFLGVKC